MDEQIKQTEAKCAHGGCKHERPCACRGKHAETRPAGVDVFVTLLRLAVGWHFLYEGVWKLSQTNWTAAGYLRSSEWFAGPLFKAIAANPTAMHMCDLLNEWGLVLIGLGLIAGVLVRAASVAGILILAFYYVCQPPWLAATGDAHYLFLDLRLVEALVLALFVCTPGLGVGGLLRGLGSKLAARKAKTSDKDAADDSGAAETPVAGPTRRDWLGGLASCTVLAAFGGLFLRWKLGKVDAVTSATAKAFEFTGLDKLSHPIDQFMTLGRGVKVSRLILGGGMISGYAHPRDLKYLSGPNGLMKAYNTPERARHTLAFAEKAGINTMIINPLLIDTVTDYWKRTGGKIQFITNCGYHGAAGAGAEAIAKGLVQGAKMSVDRGAASCFMRGEYTDDMAAKGQVKLFAQCLEEMKKLPVPIGIGCHEWKTVKFCLEHDIVPDYWMLTFNSRKYWSATPSFGTNHDNCWCTDPEGLKEYMKTVKQPWIAFKVLGAGAIHPREGFPYAFNNGADAICVGMFDFQMVENVNLVNGIFKNGLPQRARPWHS